MSNLYSFRVAAFAPEKLLIRSKSEYGKLQHHSVSIGRYDRLSAIADKIKLPYPILLVTAGIAVGFIPGMPKTELDPEIVFLLFLPPMLYDAAFNISFREFKKNLNTISTLAFALVFLTAVGIAVTAYFLIPGMTWPLAFVLEFPYVLENIDRQQLIPLIGYSFLICIVALVIRMARVFLQKINIDRAFQKTQSSKFEDAQLDWKSSLIISWSGMRGIVSLATALALPVTLTDGSAFPQRDTIIFIAVVTVLITLVGQGLSLPMLVKWLSVGTNKKEDQRIDLPSETAGR